MFSSVQTSRTHTTEYLSILKSHFNGALLSLSLLFWNCFESNYKAKEEGNHDLHLFPRVKIPRNLFPRGLLQGTNVARHLFSKGNGFPSGAIPRVSNSKGIDLHVLHIPREHFPRPNFQGPISKVQFPRPNFQVPISKSQFPTPF